MQFGLAQFAVVFFRKICLVMEAHTATMLPDETFVALDEKVASLFRKYFRVYHCQFQLAIGQWVDSLVPYCSTTAMAVVGPGYSGLPQMQRVTSSGSSSMGSCSFCKVSPGLACWDGSRESSAPFRRLRRGIMGSVEASSSSVAEPSIDSERCEVRVFFRLVEEFEEPVCEGAGCGLVELRALEDRRGDIWGNEDGGDDADNDDGGYGSLSCEGLVVSWESGCEGHKPLCACKDGLSG